MRKRAFRNLLNGNVEIDETYIGARKSGKRGRGAEGKSIVLGMVQRGGEMNAQHIPNAKRKTLFPMIASSVESGTRVMTDQFLSYNGLSANFQHDVVNHGREYVSGKDIHVNTAESFFALLKRGIHGTFHHIDKKMVNMYCGEFGFRFNTRSMNDLERFVQAVTHCDGRLQWFFNGRNNYGKERQN
jgi:transposase-like protein